MLLLPITCPLIHPVCCCTINCTVRVHYEIYVFFISSNSKCHYKQMSPPRILQEQKRDQKLKEQSLLFAVVFVYWNLWKTKLFLFLKIITLKTYKLSTSQDILLKVRNEIDWITILNTSQPNQVHFHKPCWLILLY